MSSNARNCYSRNGTQIDDVAYQPCNSDGSHDSVCCGTNHQGAGHTNVANDVCDANGLCQNFEAFDGTNGGVKVWWRQGCTDPTWQSEHCLKDVCNFAKWQADNAPVQKCSDGKWCCGEKSCCSITSSLFQLAATLGPTPTPGPASISTMSTSANPSARIMSSTGNSFAPRKPIPIRKSGCGSTQP
ncbi:hypothetical protein HBI62_022660 [Parastagonospora nodorum]|nr:hypothetical protein HBI62_022660 [Parastagonospora nodorum]